MTRKMLLIAGVAGLALAAPASAEKGGRGGDDQPQQAKGQKDGDQQAQRPQRQERRQVEREERPQRMERAEEPRIQREERSQRIERQVEREERPQRIERQVQREERSQRVERQQQREERPQRIERQQQRIERQQQREERSQRVERQQQREERPQRIERQQQRVERQAKHVERRDMIRAMPQDDRQQRKVDRGLAEQLFGSRTDNRGAVRDARFDGRGDHLVAPLGASRDMRQMRPFKAKFKGRNLVSIGDRIDRDREWTPVPAFYASRYVDTPDYYYRYDDGPGTIYRIERDDNIVRSLIPMFGGYGVGDPWPATYYSSYVPLGYQDYYYDTPDYYYRNDGYGIYQVDSSTQLITALVALLTGQGYGIGQTLPASYGVYNVPMDYRSSYQDTDDSWYRYGDGFIYQMDPTSRRVAARYPIYTDDYYVGDAWPGAYPDYNVPYGYRSTYYDTPQYQYRYADDAIYQVDPTNQVILALAALLSGDRFAVGQPLPSGYDSYNVPLDYRDRYADSDDEYYRYANGYVYQVDPRSGLIEEQFPIYA